MQEKDDGRERKQKENKIIWDLIVKMNHTQFLNFCLVLMAEKEIQLSQLKKKLWAQF